LIHSGLQRTIVFQHLEPERTKRENDVYQANTRHLMLEREELEWEKASMDDARKAMQSKMEKQKEMEIKEAKQELSDKSSKQGKNSKKRYKNWRRIKMD
jgi:hypothetical protein